MYAVIIHGKLGKSSQMQDSARDRINLFPKDWVRMPHLEITNDPLCQNIHVRFEVMMLVSYQTRVRYFSLR